MWLTPEDYFNFVRKYKIVYFQVDLKELLDEIYEDAELLSGFTFNELNERCLHDYDTIIASCPEDMSFEQYLDQYLYPDIVLYRKVLLALHKYFLDN